MESIPDKTLWMSAVRIKWNVVVTKYSNRWSDVASANVTGAWLIPWWGPPTTSPLRSFSEKVSPLMILKTLLTETQTIIVFLRSVCVFFNLTTVTILFPYWCLFLLNVICICIGHFQVTPLVVIGGVWGSYCMRCWWVSLPSMQIHQQKPNGR